MKLTWPHIGSLLALTRTTTSTSYGCRQMPVAVEGLRWQWGGQLHRYTNSWGVQRPRTSLRRIGRLPLLCALQTKNFTPTPALASLPSSQWCLATQSEMLVDCPLHCQREDPVAPADDRVSVLCLAFNTKPTLQCAARSCGNITNSVALSLPLVAR